MTGEANASATASLNSPCRYWQNDAATAGSPHACWPDDIFCTQLHFWLRCRVRMHLPIEPTVQMALRAMFLV